MSKQAEHYETVGDSLTGEKAIRAYKAAQNHLMISDENYAQDLNRIQGKIADSSEITWGGKREGAGRPSTGRKRIQYFITDREDELLRAYLAEVRKAKTLP